MTDSFKNKLVEDFGFKISSLAHRMIFDNELAKEAAQEVWFEVFKSIESFNQLSDISTWIYTVAKRTISRYAKSEKTLTSTVINHHFELDPTDYSGVEEEKRQWAKEKCDYCLTAFCHCLNNEARLIFLFRSIAELPYSQISEVMGVKEDNIRKIASRSKEKVRYFMNKDCVLYNPEGNCRCRIQNHIKSVQLDDEYKKLAKAAKLIDLFKKFDKELPRKNYWEKFII